MINPIKQLRDLKLQLDKIEEFRSVHPELFGEGSCCELAYKQLQDDIEEIMPKAKQMLLQIEALKVKFGLA